MKVAINACYGGYGLSDEAVMLYAKKKGIKLYKIADARFQGLTHFYTVPQHDRTNDDEDRFWPGNIERDDPTLIRVIEEIGDSANGLHAKIELVEHPDGIPWKIVEYDGQESLVFDLSLYENMLELSLTNEGMKELLDRCRVFYELAKKDTE